MTDTSPDKEEEPLEEVALTKDQRERMALAMAANPESTSLEAERLALAWEARGTHTTDLQVLAAAKDFHAAKGLEEIAETLVTNSKGERILTNSWAKTAHGRAAIRLHLDLMKAAAGLRTSGVTHSAQRDVMIAQGNIKAKGVAAEPVEDEPEPLPEPVSAVRAMREAASASG